MESQSSKPKFDKKKWREKKYDKKFQVKQWEDKKKVILKSKLQRQLKKDQRMGPTFFSSEAASQPNDKDVQQARLSRVKQAQVQFKRKQEEKERLEAKRLKKKEEIADALEKYNKKKSENFKLLTKKTKKGQPVMRGRMQLLFEQVKKTIETPQ